MTLDGAVAVVTGGGTGIGRAVALGLARRRARVAVCGRRPEPLEETAKLLADSGGRALAIAADVRDRDQVRAMVERVSSEWGTPLVLVNNAGLALRQEIACLSEADWDSVVDTNLKGAFLCIRQVLPGMLERGSGVVVNVASVLGKTGIAGMGAYCASKFGLLGLTQSLADELRSSGLRVYAVCPGATRTDLHVGVVGEQEARRAMDPARVAEQIVGLVTGDVVLDPGGDLVVEPRTPPPGNWRPLLKRALGPALPVVRRLRQQLRG